MKGKLIGMAAGIGFILCSGSEAKAVSLQQFKAEASQAKVSLKQEDKGERYAKSKKHQSKKHQEYTFKVLFNSGEERDFTGRINFSKEDSTYSLVSDDEAIKASETKQISRFDEATGKKIVGATNGNKWLFPVIEGKINGYSTFAETNAGYVTHISRNGSGQLYSFEISKRKDREQTGVMLQELIHGNTEAEQLMREFRHKDRKQQLAQNIALGGLSLAVIGVAAPVLGTALVVGAPAGLTAGLAAVSVKTVDLLEVIATYNSTEAIALF
ncbi:hypothetical protein [Pontibacter harenae]|uniref:hypothetical protein n=1 Tax=Pontibacter harenae TaxID=2894083 RepID=UPI001E3236F8|nr:hypothetical protein [Pontibacter harenae]MCC9168157.1 hypothetical protein [Pontibacter harenae]